MQEEAQHEVAWNYPFVDRWGITVLPAGWMLIPNFGIRQIGDNTQYIISNIALSHDPLPDGKTLAEYIEKQRGLIADQYQGVKFAGPQPVQFSSAEEAYMLLLRHTTQRAIEMLHVQHYVRVGSWIGIVTLTAPEQALRAVRPDHEAFLKGLHILPKAPPQPEYTEPQYQ